MRRDTPVWVKRALHAAPGLLAALEHKLRTMPAGAEAAGAPAAAAGGTAAGVDVAGLCAEEAVRGPPPPPPPPPRTDGTRLVPRPVLIGHAASFTPYSSDTPRRALPATAPSPVPLPTLLCQLISCCMELR